MVHDQAPQHLLTGQAGVFRVISELMLRGINSYLPSVDVGIDLILGNALKIQVKTARLRIQTMKNGSGNPYEYGPAYFWSLNCSSIGAQHKYTLRKTKYSDQVHYMVFWGVDENRFWVVPPQLLDSVSQLVLFSAELTGRARSKVFKQVCSYENRWDLLTV